MADRKGKPVTPIKTLTKKEQQELKKKASRLGDVITMDMIWFL